MVPTFRRVATVVAAASLITAVPIPALADTDALAANASTDTPAFIQEGTPAPRGGRLIQLDGFEPDRFSYATGTAYGSWFEESPDHPAGVLDTAFAVSSDRAYVQRTDGRVHEFGSSTGSQPQPAEGTSFTTIVTSPSHLFFALQSDGQIVTDHGADILPEQEGGVGYTAIAAGNDVQYAIRTDGRLVGFASYTSLLACEDAWTPATGQYVAVSAGGLSWMALRSDGAVVTCGYGGADVVDVVVPAEGIAFTGIDAGAAYGLIAQSDGQVLPVGAAPAISGLPEGRTVVSLSAGTYTGAAVLDDGTLHTWGRPFALPPFPEGTDRLLAVAQAADGRTYALWDHEVLPADFTVSIEPEILMGEKAHVDVTVEMDGAPQDGYVCVVYVSDPYTPVCKYSVVTGQASFELTMFPETWQASPGRRDLRFTFAGALTSGAVQTAWVNVKNQASPTLIDVVLPQPWDAKDYTEAQVHVERADGLGVPNGVVSAKLIIGEDDETLGGWYDDRPLGSAEISGNDLVLRLDPAWEPGTYAIAVTYTPHDNDSDPARWDGTAEITWTDRPFEQVGVPTIEGEASVGQILYADPGTWAPEASDLTYIWEAEGQVLRQGRSWALPIPASALGKQITVTVVGSKYGYETTTSAPSTPTAPVQVGTFATVDPVIVGEPRVGETLSADISDWVPYPTTQTYVWKVNGFAIQSGPEATLVVPRIAQGKTITVTVTGEREAVLPATAVSLPTERIGRPLSPVPSRT